jgi:hypothetical protein
MSIVYLEILSAKLRYQTSINLGFQSLGHLFSEKRLFLADVHDTQFKQKNSINNKFF